MNRSDQDLPGPRRLGDRTGVLSTGTLRVPARPKYLAIIGTVVEWFAHQAGLSDEKCRELEVAVDEACTNVIRHAFSGPSEGEMSILCSPVDGGLAVTIADQGKPFHPEQGSQIAAEKRSRDPASGGRGLLLIRQLTDAIHYRWDEQEGNQLTLVKHQ